MEEFHGNWISRGVYVKGRIIIFLMAFLAAVLQGNYYTSVAFGAAGQVQLAALFTIGLFAAALYMSSKRQGRLTDEAGLLYIIFGGMLMRFWYVLFTDIWTLQNDGGTFTGFGTPDINNGHIGYVEYIYKFFHIPDMDPYEHFGYYHPPFHHIIEAIWMTIQRLIGVPEPLAFENMQVPTLIYSALCMLIMLHILEESGVSKKLMSCGMLLFAFHPRMMVLAGSVNNDILALLLLLVTIWRVQVWIREKTFLNIILIALSLGFGMLSKLNTAICAFSIALIFLLHFIRVVRSGNRVVIKNIFLQYVTFGAVCIPIGLSYIVRNIVRFGEKPGIPSPALIPNESVMYTGDYSVWSIIGVPSVTDFHVEFPFHPLSAKAIHNTWVILFQTGLFAEVYPTTIGDALLSFAQIAYVASIILAVVTTVVFLWVYAVRTVRQAKMTGQEDECLLSTFMFFTYVFMLLSFCLYVFKYPYTCSSDFRYMTASLVFTSLGFVEIQMLGGKSGGFGTGAIHHNVNNTGSVHNSSAPAGSVRTGDRLGSILRFTMNTAMAATLICSLIVYLNWEI